MEKKINDYNDNEDHGEEYMKKTLYDIPNQNENLDVIIGTEVNNLQKKYSSSKDMREESSRIMESWKDNP